MRRDLFKDMLKYLPGQIVPGIVAFVTIPIVSRLFPPQAFGEYSIVTATTNIFAILMGWISMSITRFYPAYEKEGRLSDFYKGCISMTGKSFLAILSVYVLGLMVAKRFISPSLFYMLVIGGGVFVCNSGYEMLKTFLRIKRDVFWFSGFTIWKSVSAISIGLFLIMVLHTGIEGLLWGMILANLLAFPLLWKKAFGGTPLKGKLSSEEAMGIFKYGYPLVVGNLAAWILSLADRYIIQIYRGSWEVGIYSASYKLSEPSIMLLGKLFTLASGPIMVHIYEKKGLEKSKEFLHTITRFYLMLCIPLVFGLSIMAKPLVQILLAKGYLMGYKIIPIVSAGAFFLGLQQRYQTGFILKKKTYAITRAIIYAGLLNVALNVFFVPKYGYIAAAFTTLISYIFLTAIMYFSSSSLYKWKFPTKALAKSIISSLLMGGVLAYILVTPYTPLMKIILSCIVGPFIYFLSLILLKEIKKDEIKSLILGEKLLE